MTVNPLDVHIGRRLATARRACGLSAEQGASLLSLDVKALGLIETGETRASAQTLYAACRGYSVPIAFFFEGSDPRAN